VPDTTHPIRHFPRPDPKRKNQYSQPTEQPVPNNRCSTLEQPPQHIRP
jgi:hypothetical protein